jgi:hypothetical protein
MSNVFEHLYNPKKFIENCKKNNVENIVISIPNMNDLSKLNVFNHHTFLYNDDDIEYIFKVSNYNLVEKKKFIANDKSFPCLFFHFKLFNNDNETIINRKIIENRHIFYCNILKSF